MKLLLTLTALFTVSFCFAQRQNVYFLKNNGKYVNIRDSADYIRLVKEPDAGSTLYNISEYYKNGTRKLIGKSTTIDPPRFEDSCTRFYQTGMRKSVTTYKKGQAFGNYYEFYPNGKPYLVAVYSENNQTDYAIKESYDSLGTVLIVNGNGIYKGYDDAFQHVVEEGGVKSGRKNGLWKGNYNTENLIFTEHYDNGRLISGTADQSGNITTYAGQRGTPPQFPGGLQGFGNYLSSNIQYPTDARKKNIEGSVIISLGGCG